MALGGIEGVLVDVEGVGAVRGTLGVSGEYWGLAGTVDTQAQKEYRASGHFSS